MTNEELMESRKMWFQKIQDRSNRSTSIKIFLVFFLIVFVATGALTIFSVGLASWFGGL